MTCHPPLAERLAANAECGHSLDPRDVASAVSEGICPTCKTPLQPCEHRYCGCCGWVWTDQVVATLSDVAASLEKTS